MRILIIGGTGNISRWFVRKLAEQGNDLTLYNRGTRHIDFPGKIKYLTGDRTRHYTFEQEMKQAGTFDVVIDMAGYEPEDARSVIRAFSKRTGQFIFCSTVDVFKKLQPAYPLKENAEKRPSATFPYAYKKWEMENILLSAYNETKFPLTILRPAATYSEGWSPLVTPFGGQTYHLDRLRKGKPVILHGDGSAIWVSTHAEDTAKAFIGAAGNSLAIGKTYNVTGDELMTWQSMHCLVAGELHAIQPRFEYIPTSLLALLAPAESEWCVENFQYNNIFDNTAAKNELGFEYTISFREGVKRCLDHLFVNQGIEDCSLYDFYDKLLDKWEDLKSNI